MGDFLRFFKNHFCFVSVEPFTLRLEGRDEEEPVGGPVGGYVVGDQLKLVLARPT